MGNGHTTGERADTPMIDNMLHNLDKEAKDSGTKFEYIDELEET
jgi:hypothetical protein